MDIRKLKKPRCFLLYALAPDTVSPPEANQVINTICADEKLPLSLYHDHFIGQIGGLVIFFAETDIDRAALQVHLGLHLKGWTYAVHPLIYSRNPAGLDEQIAYTLRAYRDADWKVLQGEERPSYGNPSEEAQMGREIDDLI